MSDKIYEGWFFKAFHFGDNRNIMRHPFLAIGINKNKIVCLQFTSAKYEGNMYQSYFSSEVKLRYREIPVNTIFGVINQHELLSNIVHVDINHGLKYHSIANIDKLHVFDFNDKDFHKFRLLEECEDEKWEEIISKLQTITWKDDFINDMVHQW